MYEHALQRVFCFCFNACVRAFSFVSFIVLKCLSNIVSSVIGCFVFSLHCFVVIIVVVIVVVCFLIEITVFKHSTIQIFQPATRALWLSMHFCSTLFSPTAPTLSLLIAFLFFFSIKHLPFIIRCHS